MTQNLLNELRKTNDLLQQLAEEAWTDSGLYRVLVEHHVQLTKTLMSEFERIQKAAIEDLKREEARKK